MHWDYVIPSSIHIVVVVVVLTLAHTIGTMQCAVTGQAPITLERKITSGGKHIKRS